MKRRGFIGILAGAFLASRVEVFGEVPPVVERLPDAGLILVVNPAYTDAPFEQVVFGSCGQSWHEFASRIELRQPGDPPKGLGLDPLPPRFETRPGKPGFYEVPPFVAVAADGTDPMRETFGVDSPAPQP